MRLGIAAALTILVVTTPVHAQIKWYKFDKGFIQAHYSADGSAIGTITVSVMHPGANVHKIDCGGNDGELHIGIALGGLRSASGGFPVAPNASSGFGIVAEPPNVKTGTQFFQRVEGADGSGGSFYGYFRVWDEGHDVGPVHPSDPHHVFEVHPAWGIQTSAFTYLPRPAVIFPMTGYSGYGASKFKPLLAGLPSWLHVAEDNDFVYVQMAKADNFYQLRVTVKGIHDIANGARVAALVDVYSDIAHQNLVYQNLTVVTAANSRIATQLQSNSANWQTYLLGFFSVNLSKAKDVASGHSGTANSVSAPDALEFFAFGVPLQHAVSASAPCTEEDD